MVDNVGSMTVEVDSNGAGADGESTGSTAVGEGTCLVGVDH